MSPWRLRQPAEATESSSKESESSSAAAKTSAQSKDAPIPVRRTRTFAESKTFWRQQRELFGEFLRFFWSYIYDRGYVFFSYIELLKDLVVGILYKRRGKFARPFLHTALMSVLFLGITFGPLLVSEATAEEQQTGTVATSVIQSATGDTPFVTEQSEEVLRFRGGEVIEHSVQDGETISSIAQKYSLAPETIYWENNLTDRSTIKPGDRLRILPVDGIRHKVAKGETIYTIAKKYGLGDSEADAQPIVSFPFNTFADDQAFSLATGQYIFIPNGVKPEPSAPVASRGRQQVTTPDAGSVSPTGSFVWPASGYISQGFYWGHRAIDIASRGGGPILAADAGTVVVAGWVDNSGYGNRVMVDHGNGTVTLYAHLSVVRVQVGQTVNRGDVLGDMGTTGRSTGVHLHFEIRQGGSQLNPQNFLR
jgi:murein DD-endopeptidase MepM/ murein hydrolase activator NlpD